MKNANVRQMILKRELSGEIDKHAMEECRMRRQLQDCAGGERQANCGHERANTARCSGGRVARKSVRPVTRIPRACDRHARPCAAPTGDKSDRKNDQGRDEHDRLRRGQLEQFEIAHGRKNRIVSTAGMIRSRSSWG